MLRGVEAILEMTTVRAEARFRIRTLLTNAGWPLLSAVAIAFGIAATPHPVTGQPRPGEAAAPTADRLREEADALQLNLREQESGLEQIERQQEDILTALDRTNQLLQQHQREAAALGADMEELDQKIDSTRTAMEDLARRIRSLEIYLSRRLVALYKINRMGTLHLLAPADSVVEVLRRKTALERILAHDERTRQAMAVQYADLQELQRQLISHQEDKRVRMAEYEQQSAAVQRERARREILLARIRDKQEIQRAAIEALKEAARQLEKEIQSLSRQPEGRGLQRPTASKPLAVLKGLLIFPVKGKIQNSYGPYRHPRLNVQGFRNGIDIAAERGEPVRAVHAGTVLYAGWFKVYGNIVVIDHGDHYYTVYAHLEDIFKSVDHRVEAGDVIATVGDSGAMGATTLYFEIRHHDRPLDPLEWLKRG
jgi:septal ring factor EnvC (AmiA/AmiB activator)